MGLKVSEEQLYEAADSMMAVVLASKKGIPIAQARKSITDAARAQLSESASSALSHETDWRQSTFPAIGV